MAVSPRYQVFISSTYTDLIEERQALILALLQLRALPAGMELFPAADDEAWDLIKRVIDESDYYLLIIGGRYGSVGADGISFTEKEYDYAVSQKKPVMAFLHKSPAMLPFQDSEGDPAAREKLTAFRKKVEGAKHVKFWSGAEDLAGKVALSFAAFTSTYPAVGWVPANSVESAETLLKLTAAQERIAQLEGERKAEARQPPPGVEGLADDDEYLDLTFHVQAVITNLIYAAPISRSQRLEVEGSATWNEIVFSLGTLMLDESTQEMLLRRFNSAMAALNREVVEREFREWLTPQVDRKFIGDAGGDKELEYTTTIAVDRGDFETALLQLEALGVVERGKKKRTASDRQTYWTLTPWGRTRLTQLRAVRSGETKPPSSEESNDAEVVE